jgi:nucleoid DNA-binding protein
MEELVNLIVKKTGISKEQAQTAVKTVLDFLKQKLPAPIASQVDGALEGDGAQNLMKGLGNLLGK